MENKLRLRHIVPIACLMLAAAAVPWTATAQPTFSKAFDPSTIGPGSVSTLRFDISNTDPVNPVRGVAFTDVLPTGVTIATPANVWSTCGGALSAPHGGNTISLDDGGVAAGGSCEIMVNVTSSTPGTHTNLTSNLTSDAGSGSPATADLVVATDRPGFSKSFSPAAVFFGGRSTLTLTINNTANPALAANLTFVDNLPSGMVIADPANASSDCSNGTLSAPAGGSVISFGPAIPGGATVAAGASCSISVDLLGNAVGELGNTTGELTSTPQFGFTTRSSGKASAALAVSFEQLSLTKSFVGDPVAPGETVTLEFTVRNLDRRSPASNISFTDDLDAALSGLTAVGLPLADPCGPGSTLTGTSLLSLSGGNLGVEASCTFGVTLQVPAAAIPGTYTNTTGSITASIGGSPVTGDPATDLLFVAPVPRLTKEFIDDPVGASGSVTLRFGITNTSSTSQATDIAFIDELTTFLPFPVSASLPAAGFCGPSSSISLISLGTERQGLSLTGGNLAAADSCTFDVTLDIPAGMPSGSYVNTTEEIIATVDGSTVTGNPASDSLAVVAAPSLYKEFIDDPVAPGDTVTLQFTLSHDEFAPADATAITFSDDLAATLTGLAATGTPIADVCGVGSELSGTSTLLLTGGSLAPGESCTFGVTLQVPAAATAGAHNNTTSAVVATVAGVSATGYQATDDLRIAGLTLTKEFIDDPVLPGDTVTLRFTVENVSPIEDATAITFFDDLDNVVDNLAATGLPLADICGTGSSLGGLAGDTLLRFDGGTLAAGEQCSFDVTLQVPAAAVPDTYQNTTSQFSATVGGATVPFDNAADQLTITGEVLLLTKEFTNDPVAPGETVNLRFTLTNLNSSLPISDISFTDDLELALEGLVSTSGTLTDVCGVGSQLSGTDLLSFSGGSLAAAGSCVFDVTLLVGSLIPLGTVATNTTSQVSGVVGAIGITADPASDQLQIDFVDFSKAFDGDVTAGDTVSLFFTISNLSATNGVSELSFSDDLDAMIPGLASIGLPQYDVCGEGSMLAGTGAVTLTGGNLAPAGSCTFGVVLQVPSSTPAGSYINVTSDLLQFGTRAAAPAKASLVVIAITDEDQDGVLDGDDFCPGTVIPEGVPTVSLKTNRYALVDDDFVFDTKSSNGNGPGEVFTTTATGGCSCEQIIAAMGLGQGHVKHGCSIGAMRDWVGLINPVYHLPATQGLGINQGAGN